MSTETVVAVGGYDAVASSFARLSRRFTAPLAAHLVSLASPRPADRVLDVGTGTGVVALEAARRLGPSGRVLGIDLAPRMLDEARAAAGGLDHLEFREMDAQALLLEDASFDAACSLFALSHFADPSRVLREMHRVLRPGGRLAVGVGATPPFLSFAGLRVARRRLPIRLALRRGRCLVAPGSLGSALAHRGHSTAHPPTLPPSDLRRLVRDAGFADPSLSWECGEAAIGSAEELWEVEATFSTPARQWLAGANLDEAEALRSRVVREAAGVLSRGGRLLYLYGACLLTARRP